jgi:hypothetical protein
MLEADVVASHTLDAGSLTSCAPRLAIVAYNNRKGRWSVRPVLSKKNRDFRLSSLTLEMPEPAVLTNKPVSSSAATLLFRSGRINMLTYQPVLVLGTAEPESSAVVEAAAAAITSSL